MSHSDSLFCVLRAREDPVWASQRECPGFHLQLWDLLFLPSSTGCRSVCPGVWRTWSLQVHAVPHQHRTVLVCGRQRPRDPQHPHRTRQHPSVWVNWSLIGVSSSLEWWDSSSASILFVISGIQEHWTHLPHLNNKLSSPTQVLTSQWLLPRWVRHRGLTFTPSLQEHTCCSLRVGRSNTSLWTDTKWKRRRPNLCCTSLWDDIRTDFTWLQNVS